MRITLEFSLGAANFFWHIWGSVSGFRAPLGDVTSPNERLQCVINFLRSQKCRISRKPQDSKKGRPSYDQHFHRRIHSKIMAPCVPEKETEEITKISKVLELGNLRKAIPVIAFEKSLMKSCYYLVFDYTCWFASLLCMIYLSKSGFWDSLSQWQQVLASLAYWNVSGFFMWCLFVVGHDCGHSTFSNSELLNDIVGHLVHGSILVPFYPWQVNLQIFEQLIWHS